MISSWSTCHKILHILMFITSFGEQNITYKCCSNFLIHLCFAALSPKIVETSGLFTNNISIVWLSAAHPCCV
ncbi:hypothetical protein GPS45_04020 [Acinetobacter haemolyticus]|nr:hypothetical protein [Acinetobacter haemolyticus]